MNLKATRNLLNDIDLIVYDMAGTTVQDCVDKNPWEWSSFFLSSLVEA